MPTFWHSFFTLNEFCTKYYELFKSENWAQNPEKSLTCNIHIYMYIVYTSYTEFPPSPHTYDNTMRIMR